MHGLVNTQATKKYNRSARPLFRESANHPPPHSTPTHPKQRFALKHAHQYVNPPNLPHIQHHSSTSSWAAVVTGVECASPPLVIGRRSQELAGQG